MAKLIPLTRGQFAIVDDDDFEWLSQWKWCYHPTRHGYALRGVKTPERKTKLIYMHNVIMSPPVDFVVDHKNLNSLDNQRDNLRLATHSQNSANRTSSGGSSAYKGVSWRKSRRRWRSSVTVNKKSIDLGVYRNEEDAARAYDAAALLYFGEFARLNFPLEAPHA